MGAKEKTIGGGPAKPLAADWSKGLQGLTPDVAQWLNDVLTPGFTDPLSSSTAKLGAITRQQGIDAIHARYALGGTGYGTPASSAEASYGAEFDPQLVNLMSKQKSDVALNLAALINQFASRGVPQAQTVLQPSPLGQAVSGLTSIAGAAAPFLTGSPLPAATAGPPTPPTPFMPTADTSWLKKLNIPQWGY